MLAYIRTMALSVPAVTSLRGGFNIVVDTTESGSASDTFILPLFTGETYDFDVNWGDGNSEHISSDSDVTHIYDSSGSYTVEITGVFPRIYFNNSGDKLKITDIAQWGNTSWSSMGKAFWGCSNLEMSAPDAPNLASVTDTSYMFKACVVFNSSINHWDTSNVTDMREMFNGCIIFNQPVSFNTSNAQYMNIMFGSCNNFNQSVDDLDFSSATTLYAIFSYCTAFNSSIAMMDTSSCTNFDSMFAGCPAFNQDVSHFDTSLATTFAGMFYGCTAFDQDVSGWDISSLTNCLNFAVLSGFSTTNYDLLLVAWEGKTHNNTVRIDVPCKYSTGLPQYARARLVGDSWTVNDDGVIANFTDAFTMTVDTTKTGSASDTFILPVFPTETYDYWVDWGDGDVDNVTVDTNQTKIYTTGGVKTIKITGIFPRIYFNNGGDKLKLTDITQWGNIAWGSMYRSFYGCADLVGTWSDAPDLTNLTSLKYMFRTCYDMNGILTGWDTSNVTDFSSMFYNCKVFNQAVPFDTSSALDMNQMFYKCYAFDGDISSFDTTNCLNMIFMFSLCYAFNQSISHLDFSGETDMNSAFADCHAFNQPVTNLVHSGVTDLSYMFYNCYAFNQSVASWNTSGVVYHDNLFENCTAFNSTVTNLVTSTSIGCWQMFIGCTNFNQDVSSFDTSNCVYFNDMFKDCTNFNQDLSSWDITALGYASSMLNGSAFDTTNYDLLLVAWEAQVELTGVTFHAGTAKYSAGAPATARAGLVSSSWSITDAGPV